MKHKNTPKTGLARLLQLAAMKKPWIIAAVVLASLASVVSFIPYLSIYFIVREVLSVWPNTQALNRELLIRYGWYAFGGAALNILLYFCAIVCSHMAAFGTLYELKINFATHLARVPLGFHTIIGSGKLRKIMDENIEKVEGFIAHQLPDTVAAFVAPVVMIVILLAIDWRFGLAALLGVAIAFIMQSAMYGNEGVKGILDKYQRAVEEMNNASVEYIRGISVVKAFRQTVYSFRRLHETIKAYTAMIIPYTLSWQNSFSAFVALTNNIYLFIVPVAIFAGMNSSDFTTFASSTIFYFIFVPAIASIFMKVMYVNSLTMRVLSDVEAMDALLAEPELPQPLHPRAPAGHSLEFCNVSFSYDKSKETEALRNVSFRAEPGQVTAIVGPSGGGKSTIAHLIPRFFDVGAGAVKLGGVDVRDIPHAKLMEQVSFVFQDVFLFKQSIKDNILIGNRQATQAQVEAAAKAAQCHDFIVKLPQGYDTVIGTRGIHLSGGERQRLAIARAIVKNSPIIVLDEATAFADPENEHLIQKAFEKLMKGKTVVIIAHRLATVRSADKIVVLVDGQVAEQGTHSQLLENGGRYADMWKAYNTTACWVMQGREARKNA